MYSTKNVTVRCYEVDSNAIQRAADKAGKSLSDYCRDVLIPWAYSDLGEKRPNLPTLERGRHTSMVEQAAKARGMTREQFERLAVESMAASELGVLGPADSGERLRFAAVGIPPRPMRKPDGRYASNGASSGSKER